MALPDIPNRVRAARELAGLRSVEALAEAIGEGGLGTTTLRKIEQGNRHAEPRELRQIASSCDLPYEFFTMDFWDAAKAERASDIEAQARAMLARVKERESAVEEMLAKTAANVALVEQHLAKGLGTTEDELPLGDLDQEMDHVRRRAEAEAHEGRRKPKRGRGEGSAGSAS